MKRFIKSVASVVVFGLVLALSTSAFAKSGRWKVKRLEVG